MADAEVQAGFKRRAEKKSKPRYKSKKPKNTGLASKDTRVSLGSEMTRWTTLKVERGLKTSQDVATFLLDAMERSPHQSTSSGSSENKMKFSQSEMQALIEKETQAAIEENEIKVLGMIDAVMQIDKYINYDRSINKLQAKINTLTNRANLVFAHTLKTDQKVTVPLDDVDTDNLDLSHSEERPVRTEPPKKISKTARKSTGSKAKKGNHFEIMESSKKALAEIQENKEALTTAMADLKEEERPPPALSPFTSFPCKKEEDDELEHFNHFEEKMQFEEQKSPLTKMDSLSSTGKDSPKQTTPEQPKNDQYPPLPAHDFPSTLNMEAASYSIPQKVQVRLALIKKPPGLSVLWNVEREEPCAPPMKSYRIYITMEKKRGSGVFGEWTIVGEVKAGRLPMCVLISKYKPGHKLYVSVVGVDKFGRYGPYSEVVNAVVPMIS